MKNLSNEEIISYIENKIKTFDEIYTSEYAKQIWLSNFRKNKINNLKQNLEDIDTTIKNNLKFCIWIWIYEELKEWNVLLYWTRSIEKKIEWKFFTVIFFKVKWDLENIDKYEEFFKRINYYLWKTSNTCILKYIDRYIIPQNKYEYWKWIWRILSFFQKHIFKRKINQKRYRINNYINLWKQNDPIKFKDLENWILDHYFWKSNTIIPWFNLNEKLKQKLQKVYDAKKTYENYISKYINEKEIIPEEKWEYLKHKTESQYWDALSSALIEWYDENDEEWQQAIENIFTLHRNYNWEEKFDIKLLEDMQSNVVENLNKEKWIRDWEVFVIQKISDSKINIKYAAPNSKDVYRMLNEYTMLLDYYVENNIDPFIISILLSTYFVQIHPFFDWNWRTSRFLIIYILKKLWIIDNYYDFQVSRFIEEDRKKYYNMLMNVWLPVVKNWKVITNEYWERFTEYESYSIYQDFDYEYAFDYFFEIFEKVYFFQILDHQYYLRKKDFQQQIKEQIWEISDIQNNLLKNISIEYLQNWQYKLNKDDIWQLEMNFWNNTNKILKILDNLKEKYSKIEIPKLESSVFDKFKSLFK